ncbi:hypothetical protein C5B94_10785 [Clavibacter michiganensis]|uniref:DUF4012 domain-containing protein n=1 Tax=Clavibacter michiganensis TaxID=28447 RepID=UPI000CE84E17|nr:DUF4012 domain-containing protein [Clavibacter michiganensis]PPF53120.1 hypothetical protein C5B94_10785 [Clavibacter michiganensis]
MTSSTIRSRRVRRARRPWTRRRVVGTAAAVVALLLVLWIAWVSARALLARAELEQAVPLASSVQRDLLGGDSPGAAAGVAQLREHSSRAVSLTGDPVWAATEAVPLVGPNLRAFREIAGVVDRIGADALEPVVGIAGTLDVGSLTPKDGRIDLDPIIAAQEPVRQADDALDTALDDVTAIDTAETLSPVTDAVTRLRETVGSAADTLAIVRRVADLAPAMLGADGDREYLLMFQNNAEVRSTGGIPGALALVRTGGGSFSLAQQDSARAFPRLAEPALPLDPQTAGLYGTITGRYMQDVTLTPEFPEAAPLAAEMWRLKHADDIDGVISIDPVALSYLLEATGPITLSTGDVLRSDDAVDLLLHDVYLRYPDPDVQDAVFASVADSVFSKVSSGDVDPAALVKALSRAAEERRILMWNARPDEQATLAGTTFQGSLPTDNSESTQFGVFLNDATGAKMDYFLTLETTQAMAMCRDDGRPNYRTEVTLGSTAPADAASLPLVVTGGGVYGVAPGDIKTRVAVYGPPGTVPLSVRIDDEVVDFQPEVVGGRAVAQVEVTLSPGQRVSISVDTLGDKRTDTPLSIVTTPVINAIETRFRSLSCDASQ